jgi:pilus assembly protein CpaF
MDERGPMWTSQRSTGLPPARPVDLGVSRSLIWINEPTKVFIARAGVHELTTTVLSADQVRDLVEKMLKSSGRRVDLSAPFVDAMLPDGSRLHVVIPDITRRFWSVNIRKFVVRASHLDDLVALGTITAGAARFLDAAVRSGLNVLVCGGTQAGKTTLLNCLAAAVPPQERIVTCEEVFELPIPDHDVCLEWQSRAIARPSSKEASAAASRPRRGASRCP